MKVDELKDQARRHEQREEWQKALDLYRAALRQQEEDETPDITLFNRVGDIQTRLGQTSGAVAHYEKAIDLYLEAELPNNAIAICKKVLRHLPDRTGFFLRMGQIRASQGFLTDARQNFLMFAERSTATGDIEAALNALIEFVDLSPDDVEIRLALASQLESHERLEEAVDQFREAYRRLVLQDRDEEAQGLAEKIGELDGDVALPDPELVRREAEEEVVQEDLVLESTSLDGLELRRWDELDGEPEEQAPIGASESAEPLGQEAGGTADTPEPRAEVEVAAMEEALGGFGTVDLPELGSEAGPGPEAEPETDDLPFLDLEGGTAEEDEEDGEAWTGTALEPDDEEEALPTFDFQLEDELEGEGEDEAEPLPILTFDDEPEDEGQAESLEDGLEWGDVFQKEGAEPEGGTASPGDLHRETAFEEEARGEAEVPVQEPPEVSAEGGGTDGPAAPAVPGDHREAAERGDLDLAMTLVREEIQAHPDKVESYQRLVEYAFRKGDNALLVSAYVELAECLLRTGSPRKARAVFQQVLSLSPGHPEAVIALERLEGAGEARPPTEVASSEEYVDLGSMILGDQPEKTTRWKVAADAPSGDEEADFAKMLTQFKEKVSEHVAADDISAHHDLGTAYMEMGLLDEAISEFQLALRASPHHLPTHEVMGRCWIEKGEMEMAVRALRRALDVEFEIEDEFIGIYYLMGRAYEGLGKSPEAVEFYEKVFSLDINFRDVTERLRALR